VKQGLIRSAITACALLLPLGTGAEDIDLFVGPSTASTDSPNVLIILDNTANWGPDEKFQAQKAALVSAFEQLPDDQINIGLMLYSETGNPNSNVEGAYVRAATRLMNQATKADYRKLLTGDPDDPDSTGLDVNLDTGSKGLAGLAMAEAYLYYLGGDASYERPYSGNNKAKVDWGTHTDAGSNTNEYINRNNTCCTDSHDVWALPGNALDAVDSTRYNSPVDPNECADNYIIFIGNGPAQDSANDSRTARDILAAQDGVTTTETIPLTPSNSQDNMADEWAYFMNNDAPLDISTFAIDVNIVQNEDQLDNAANAGWTAVMESMAAEGGGEYYDLRGTAFDPNDFEFALLDAFNRILSRNSVFASVSLPAAANQQSTFLNQVYVGMFRPDPGALPRWHGNLKQFQLGFDDDELKVLDADGQALIDTTDTDDGGFIEGCRRSFWTPESETSPYYWDYLATDDLAKLENCTGEPAGSNTPDGGVVEKGAQGYTLRASTPGSRDVYTCSQTLSTCSATNTLPVFNTGTSFVDDSVFDANDPTDLNNTIKWAIGYDIDNEIGAETPDPNEMRPSVHGDIVHSQPVAVDYAQDPNNPEVVVFYGGNDGMLRAINGNKTTSHGGVDAGHEFWAFMPPEFYPSIRRLRLNTERIKFPASGPTEGEGSAGDPKDYGMDGPLTAYQEDTSSPQDGVIDKRTLYAGIRRAGRMIYSFDITNRGRPSMNWKVGCPNLDNDTGCTSYDTTSDSDSDSDWEAIGQTWSRVAVARAEGYDPNSDGYLDPILLVGGGYDDCEDVDDGSSDNNACSSTKGNIIYVLDAANGNVLNWFATDRSVPGNVTVVPISDDDERIMFAYAVDTGGNVYRISGGTYGGGPGSGSYAPAIIGNTDPSTWIITKIASLGCNDLNSCDANRKFLFGPDVIRVPQTDKFGILVGSGDREKPLTDYSVTFGLQNYFYSLFDQPTNAAWLNDDADATCGDDIICHDVLTDVATGDSFDPDLAISEKGWKLPLRSGEQVVTGAITVDNVVNFSTHIPAELEDCDAGYGEATAYNVNYENAFGKTTQFIGGGLVPTPVAGKVLIDGVPVPFCIGCGGEGSPIGAGKVGGGITWIQPRSRVYWNIDKVEE
jgi:type IV pilus assembly protein PilY1